MDYTNLGRTGLQVSRLCLGAMTFGRESDETVSRGILDEFTGAGGNFIDTADAYTDGASEEIIGRWLENKSRHDIVIATKVRFGSGLNKRGLSRKHILHSIENSLRRLKTDYIDLYQVHMWDASTPLEETFSTLDGLVREGRIRYIGISNFCGWQLQKAVDLCRTMGWDSVACLQPLYNLLDREAELELIPVCRNEGLGIIPWSPLRGGWLTGKYHQEMRGGSTDTRIKVSEISGKEPAWTESWMNYNNDTTWDVLDTLRTVAGDEGKTPAQIALNWLLGRPGVTAPIIGARTLEQMKENLRSTGWTLADEQAERLTRVSAKRKPYPYELIDDLINA